MNKVQELRQSLLEAKSISSEIVVSLLNKADNQVCGHNETWDLSSDADDL